MMSLSSSVLLGQKYNIAHATLNRQLLTMSNFRGMVENLQQMCCELYTQQIQFQILRTNLYSGLNLDLMLLGVLGHTVHQISIYNMVSEVDHTVWQHHTGLELLG